MNLFPLFSEGSREAGLVVGVLIGVAFGFVLERAGFGRAPKLAGQFYFRELTVFKVMFTGIVTAMLGLVAASALGLTDLRAISESIVSWTYVWPMLIGGLVLGAGFIISGYCPGTSIVAAASGNVDGMLTVAGVVTGTTAYTYLLRVPAFANFHESGAKEAWFLYDLLPVRPALLAGAIAVMAVLAFIGADAIERAAARTWRFTVPAFAVLAAFAFFVPRTPAGGANPSNQALDAGMLAKQYVAEPWRYRVEGDAVTDLASNRTQKIDGGVAAWRREPLVMAMSGGKAPAPAPSRPAGTFAKPKKKGGGCSS